MKFWSDERVEELIRLWNSDWSAQKIADVWSTSRNAVIAKVFRLRARGYVLRAEHDVARIHRGVTQSLRRKVRAQVETNKAHSFRQAFAAILAKEAQAAVAAEAAQKHNPTDVPRKSLLDLADRGECKWPVTVEGRHMFCAEPATPGLSYCRAHCQRAYMPIPQRTGKAGRPFVLPPLHTRRVMEPETA